MWHALEQRLLALIVPDFKIVVDGDNLAPGETLADWPGYNEAQPKDA
jgi:hypothetical protein